MVRVHYYFGAHQVRPKLLKGENYDEERKRGGGIVDLRVVQGSTSIVDGAQLPVLPLPQNGSNHVVTCIAHDLKWSIPIRWLDYGRGH